MYDLAKELAQPYALLMIVLGLSILTSWRQREGRKRTLLVMTSAWLAIYLISTPLVSDAMLNSLRFQFPPPSELPADIQAIVTLGGGIVTPTQFRDEPELDSVSFGRCLHAAAIYRIVGGTKIFVCGGPSSRVPDGPTVAEVMRDALIQFGVDGEDVIVETESMSTYENATHVARLLDELKVKKISLVTDSRHMPRSVMCFRKQGVDVVPTPSDFRPAEIPPPLYESLLPSASGLKASHKTFHEWLGMGWYWLHDRI